MKIKRDQLTGIVLIAASAVVCWLVSGFEKPMQADYPGPKLFPLIAAFGLFSCGAGLFISSCIKKGEEKPFLTLKGWGKVAGLFLLMVLYIFLMKYFGYLAVTPLILLTTSLMITVGEGRKINRPVQLVFAVGMALILYLIYCKGFGMLLPRGSFFE